MGRQKNDGRGRLGGRAPGTPNKENPLKGFLRAHSLEYFKPKSQTEADGSPRKIHIYIEGGEAKTLILADAEGKPLIMSDFDVDMLQLKDVERVNAEIRLLEFHTPKMKSVDVDVDLHGSASLSIEDRLSQLLNPDTDN
ncbi:MAG: hypothetical protein J1D77_03730 [Muribaculaceae bacterium]|nr:hypothetical protein [Muribaculaceae bacterium]